MYLYFPYFLKTYCVTSHIALATFLHALFLKAFMIKQVSIFFYSTQVLIRSDTNLYRTFSSSET